MWKTTHSASNGWLTVSIKSFDSNVHICKILGSMATSEREVLSLDNLTGYFNLSTIPVYNIINIGQHIIHSFESTYNFRVQLKLINRQRNCPRCRRSLKLSIERRPDHKTPVVFHCTNSCCSKAKAYFLIRDSTFFEIANLSLQQIILLVNLFCGEGAK